MPGSLFVVATPIGNLEDLTFRALRTLKEVQLIAAEDTRRTSKLLAHYGIQKPLISVREHNEAREAVRLVTRLRAGDSVALVTDAGTPGIADPGARVVAAVRAAGLPVVPIPGPSAVTAALSVAGIPSDEFTFMGFPPPSGSDREGWLARLALEPRTVVFFESPHRLGRLFGDLANNVPDRKCAVFRELTKIHENFAEYTTRDSSQPQIESVGEIVLVLEPATAADEEKVDVSSAVDMVGRLTDSIGVAEEDAVRMTATLFGTDVRRLRNALKKYRISVKQHNDRSS